MIFRTLKISLILICVLMTGCMRPPKTMYGIPWSVWSQLTPDQQQQIKNQAPTRIGPQ